ncbi:MAG TPA: EAL domain-containing protein [Steroidobacteraceae bacterium]|nr:EAL domain-containing protein [Steroidobacteraceae bacterium]
MEQGKPFSATESPLVDFDAVCQKVRAALEPARAHAVSLHDENGDVLWLSESSMGPDEHNAVREAVETFSDPKAPAILAYDLGDARSAVLLRAMSARRAMVGAIMIIVDNRILKHDEHGAIKIMTPRLQRVLMDFAGMRPDLEPAEAPPPSHATPSKPAAAKPAAKSDAPPRKAIIGEPLAPSAPASTVSRSATGRTASSRPAAHGASASQAPSSAAANRPAPSPASRAEPRRAASAPAESSAPPAAPANARRQSAPAALSAGAAPREPAPREATPREAAPREPAPREPAPREPAPPTADHPEKHPAPVSPEIDRLHAALRRSPISLHVQRLVPLTKGSQLKRYEVLLRSKSEEAPNAAPQAMLKAAVDNGLGSMIDRRVVTELVGWLVHHPDVWQQHAVMFSVNLTTTALHDEHFIKFVGLCLAKSSLPRAMIAFEVDVLTAVKMAARVGEVAAALHRLGCPMVLDDFALKTECFDLLRLPGVRYIKLAPEITTKMRTDKLSQASITAVVQMARVLGMHTVAKRMETAAEQEWLTALGVDFVQSHSMSPPASIDTLSKAETAKA